jgi:hypothetical protein
MERKAGTIEEQTDSIFAALIIEAAKIAKKYKVSRAEALNMIVYLEVAKVHSHLEPKTNG